MNSLFSLRHACGIAVAAATLGLTAAPSLEAGTFGFEFQLGNSATSNVTGTNYGGVRFTATNSITIDTLGFGLNNGSGSVTYALQADDGFGNPTGVDLASGTATGGAGYQTATITPTAIVAGNVYHVVARAVGAGAAGLRVSLGGFGTFADINTIDGSPAPNTAQMFSSNSGSTWTEFSFDSRAMVWGVANSTTGDAQGQPYTTGIVTNFGSNIYRGQTFTQDSGEDFKVSSIKLSIFRNAGTAGIAGDVRVRLFEVGTLNEVYSGTLFSAGDLAESTHGFFTHNIAELDRPTLEDGVQYMVAVDSVGSGATGVYRMITQRTDGNAGDVIQQNYQGDDGVAVIGSLNTGTGVINAPGDSETATLKHDAYFVLETVPVPEPATVGLMGLGMMMMLRRGS